ncbi:unnamed protein product [Adineta steineri]|uniref:STING ligand-binding domain-containing protein n=1 Tax=Adineta steineri TaxID=433720 RepID=A0A818STF5_9BILA|nr:unnamed protein product [Adineta steineri]CAF3667756.1 unnamed protein product [Adineta steineri]
MFNHSQEEDHNNNSRLRSNFQDDFYPLMLHANSIASGLLFNYFYSYLNRQIGSTNNIVLTFTFQTLINRESFPSSIFVKLKTLIENTFLGNYPSTIESNDVTSIESNLLEFKFESITNRVCDNNNETIVKFAVIGINDFGFSVETIYIYQNEFNLNSLTKIQLQDDIRQWQEEYQPCLPINNNDQLIITMFDKRNDPTKTCHFLSENQRPPVDNGHKGVSTLKKTTKDCLDAYRQDSKNTKTKILLVPVYYIIMPSLCEFGLPDTVIPIESDEIILRGTIKDPDEPNRIRLAFVNGEVLQSRPMLQYQRYLRRTYYYVDVINTDNEKIRYLFCGEYPYILSILDQLEKCHLISKSQKYDEYIRFCNMLNHLLQFSNLSDSIKLIQYNDDEINYADYQSPWEQIKQNINQWYRTSNTPSPLDNEIQSMILDIENNHHVVLFYTDQTKQDPLVMTFIRDLQEKLVNNGYMVDDANGNLDLINTQKQLVFICIGNQTDEINKSLMMAERNKIKKYGVFRDVFILINDAIRHFPCHFLQSVPLLTFDLRQRSARLDDNELDTLFQYLNNMNVLSKNYTNYFEDTNRLLKKSLLQCTSVGAGCAAAFYSNYLKLLSPLPDHHRRVESMREQFIEDSQSKFISKWVFVIPWTIKNTDKILPNAISINENDQLIYGYALSIWKRTNYNLKVTVGGIFQRSYSELVIYKLTNFDEGKSYYFPMEIPAALNGLQNQYDNVLSQFHFGRFNPLEQANVFREKVEEFFRNDSDKTWHENILIVSLDKPSVIYESNPQNQIQQNRILLQTLWKKLSEQMD